MDNAEIADRFAIRECLTRYAMAIDTRDWQALGQCVAEEMVLDFTALGAPAPQRLTRDEFVQLARESISGFDATLHLSLNEVVELDGERATCRAYMCAHHLLREGNSEEQLVLRGFYDLELVRDGDRRRIAHYKLTPAWTEGDLSLLERARERGA